MAGGFMKSVKTALTLIVARRSSILNDYIVCL